MSGPCNQLAAVSTEELKRLREDAARYRWLRETHDDKVNSMLNDPSAAPEQIDAAIDEALADERRMDAGFWEALELTCKATS